MIVRHLIPSLFGFRLGPPQELADPWTPPPSVFGSILEKWRKAQTAAEIADVLKATGNG